MCFDSLQLLCETFLFLRSTERARINVHRQKVKLTLEQATKAQVCGVDVQLYSLTSALKGVGSQRHAPAALPPRERPNTHCIRGWVSHMTSLDWSGEKKSCIGFPVNYPSCLSLWMRLRPSIITISNSIQFLLVFSLLSKEQQPVVCLADLTFTR